MLTKSWEGKVKVEGEGKGTGCGSGSGRIGLVMVKRECENIIT